MMHGRQNMRIINKSGFWGLICLVLFYCSCSFHENNENDVIAGLNFFCEGQVCIVQPKNSNEPLELEAYTINPKALKGYVDNYFESSVIRIYYKDEQRKKIEFISIKNGNIMTTLFFDDSIGTLQASSSKLLGYDPFFILNKNDSNHYYLK